MLVRTVAEVDARIATVEAAAGRTLNWFARQQVSPLALLRELKFVPVGFRPVDGPSAQLRRADQPALDVPAALAATRELLALHPQAEGFNLAPGAHAAQDLDIMSAVPSLVGAETFAAVHPANNQKLAGDLSKLAARQERYRYVFFITPAFPGTKRLHQLERDGVAVWSVDVA